MSPRVALWSAAALCFAAVPLAAQGAGTNPAEGCRAIGLFVFDVKSDPMKIDFVPKSLVVVHPKAGETDREVCFSVVLVNGDKDEKFEQLRLKAFDTVKGKNKLPLFRVKKEHPTSPDLISLELYDEPDWDPNGDGVLEDVVQPFDLEAKFKGKAVVFDPEIIIKKGG